MLKRAFVPALAILALSACQDAAGPGTGLTDDEVGALSDVMIADGFTVTGDQATTGDPAEPGLSLEPITMSSEFTVTRPCALGGSILVEGTRERVWDRDTHTGTADFTTTKTHQDCVRQIQDILVTLNGADAVTMTAHRAWEDGVWSGLQTLSMAGAVDWAAEDGRTGTCAIDIAVSYDPDTTTRTVTGTVCDRTIDWTTTWSGGGMGFGMGPGLHGGQGAGGGR